MAGFELSSLFRPFLLLAFCGSCYIAFVAVYRLYFSSLANFPGPRLAALTNMYQFYYDVIHDGRFIFHTQQLHKQYGQPQIHQLRTEMLIET